MCNQFRIPKLALIKQYLTEDLDLPLVEPKINDEENDEGYSMIIYFVKQGDTLWKIAKKFRSTVADIARVNGIEDENKIYVGQQLYIPKYIKKRIAV